MQDKILQHLREKYNPDSVIMHGSRARGLARELSDWDFIFLYNSPTTISSGRELFCNQNIEFSVYTLPVIDIFKTFSTKLQNAQVLFEKHTEGTDLLRTALEYYALGVHWSADKIAVHKLWFQGRIHGMKDCIDDSILFYTYYSDLYSRVTNYWYWILQKKHSQPAYIAVTEIKSLDEEYYRLMDEFSSSKTTRGQKVAVAEKIKDRLFM